MLILTGRDIDRALPMNRAIEVVSEGYIAFSAGETLTPLRTPMVMPAGTTLTMPSYIATTNAGGVKIVSVFEGNRLVDLPTITGLMVLLDGDTGVPLAIMEAATLTALRTGASGGAASDRLARSDAQRAAVIGAGVQARSQLKALFAVRDITGVYVFDVDPSRSEVFIAEMESEFPGAHFQRVSTASQAVSVADVVLCATTSRKPVIDANDLSPGSHVTGVGSYTPEMAEIGVDVLAKAHRIIVDSREACWEEAGDFIQPFERGEIGGDIVDAELGDILAGRAPGRTCADEITVFKAVGLAALDVAVATEVHQRAQDEGLGTEVELF